MIYAKFIHSEQIVNDDDEFEMFNGKTDPAIYCKGKTTIGMYDILCSVPLNYIFSCLKYGDKIAIIDTSTSDAYSKDCTYPDDPSYVHYKVVSKDQRIIDILDLTPETVDFVFNEVKNPTLIPENGYITNMEYVPYEVCKRFFELKGQPVPAWVKLNH